jgi:hypothetical protein
MCIHIAWLYRHTLRLRSVFEVVFPNFYYYELLLLRSLTFPVIISDENQ